MASVWGELKRRNVVKVAVAYAIVGWLLVEVSSTVFPIVQLPDWTVTFLTMLILFGFPVALILSWAYDLTPEGLERTGPVPVSEHVAKSSGRKLDFAIIGALVLALGFVVYNYVLEDGSVEVAAGVLPSSVAVIPFRNDSPDPDNAYYAAGIHEEILNQLVKLSALNVIARTSVQQYANTEKSIPEIARELNVETVMEGSVRYANGQIRITAQLNDGVTGAHLWSETYTRDFDDIFAIESDVAMNVANAIGAEFSLAEQANIEKIPTDSPEAYELYLKATQVERNNALRIAYLDQAIGFDPDFADARVLRASIRRFELTLSLGTEENYATRRADLEAVTLEDIEIALASDSMLGSAYSVLAEIHQYNWRANDALEAFERAIQLSPNDTSVLNAYISFLSDVDRHDEAIRLARRAVELDPKNYLSYNRLGRALLPAGEHEAVITAHREALNLSPTAISSLWRLSLELILVGDEAEAVDQARLAEALAYNSTSAIVINIAYLYFRLGLQEDATRVLNRFEEVVAGRRIAPVVWAHVNLARGDEDQAFEWLRRAVANREPYQGYNLVHYLRRNDFHDPILNQPRFVELRNQLGFTDL